MRITGRAVVAGVAGWPIAHSLSPLIHNAWIEALGLDAAYVPFAVPPERLEAFVDGARSVLSGLNVTAPHKRRALELADTLSDEAGLANAANLLLMLKGDGEIFADNTDGAGLLAALAEQAPDWRPAAGPVLILGAGGAAESAVPALLAAGAPFVRVAARNADAAWGVAERWGEERASWHGFDGLSTALRDVTLVINATPAGLNGEGEPPALTGAAPSAVVMDMVYQPLRTRFLERAAAAGHPTVDGLAMLIGQARPSFEAFFGAPPPADLDVRDLCLRALGERS